MFPALFSSVRNSLNCQVASYLYDQSYNEIISETVSRLVLSFLSADELLTLIPNIILISLGNPLLVLACFDFLYIFIELEENLHLFYYLAWFPSSTQNFISCFQLCLYFTTHHGSL